MRKKFMSVLLSAAMVASLGASFAYAEETTTEAATEEAAEEHTYSNKAEGMTLAIVTKAAGNPYNEKEADGFAEVVEGEGGTVIVQHPESATADAQIAVIQSLISQGVDAIAVAANDTNALAAVLEEAADEGIKVLTLDSDVAVEDRATFCNQAGVEQVGQALIDAVYDLTEGEGQYAILSATSQASNQNAWIEAMKSIAESDEKYAGIELVEVAYGDDEYQKSTDQTEALLTKYPDLEVICAPTTVGIAAAAKVLQDEGSSVKLTGLGLPSEMAEFIGDDDEHSCPYMFLWNPIDLGRLAGYAAIALVDGTITGEVGDEFEAGDMENSPYTLTEVLDENGDVAGSEIILGPPFQFNPENIEEWKVVY